MDNKVAHRMCINKSFVLYTRKDFDFTTSMAFFFFINNEITAAQYQMCLEQLRISLSLYLLQELHFKAVVVDTRKRKEKYLFVKYIVILFICKSRMVFNILKNKNLLLEIIIY